MAAYRNVLNTPSPALRFYRYRRLSPRRLATAGLRLVAQARSHGHFCADAFISFYYLRAFIFPTAIHTRQALIDAIHAALSRLR